MFFGLFLLHFFTSPIFGAAGINSDNSYLTYKNNFSTTEHLRVLNKNNNFDGQHLKITNTHPCQEKNSTRVHLDLLKDEIHLLVDAAFDQPELKQQVDVHLATAKHMVIQNNFPSAIEAYEKCLLLFNSIEEQNYNDIACKALIFENIADCYCKMQFTQANNIGTSILYYSKALENYDNLRNSSTLDSAKLLKSNIRTIKRLACCYFVQKNYLQVIDTLNKLFGLHNIDSYQHANPYTTEKIFKAANEFENFLKTQASISSEFLVLHQQVQDMIIQREDQRLKNLGFIVHVLPETEGDHLRKKGFIIHEDEWKD